MEQQQQQVNPNLRNKLREVGLPAERCLSYLLSVYFNLDVKELNFQRIYVLQMIKLGIIETKNAVFTVPKLFNNEPIGDVYSPEQDVISNVDEYRNCFKGCNNRAGMLGSKPDCILKLTRWLRVNNSYTMFDVIRQTKAFIEAKKKLGEQQFIPQADNFVSKRVGNEEKSTLSSIIDEEFDINSFEKSI